MQADGWSLDDKRQPLLPEEKLGATPTLALTEIEHGKNNLPDVLTRWGSRETTEQERPRTEQSFCVPKADIAANGYDLSINRYKEVVHEVIEHRLPKDIMAKLAELEEEIQAGMNFDDIRSFRLPIPPQLLQYEFCQRVEAVVKQRLLHQ
jgi:type I restriction enzyme M protein